MRALRTLLAGVRLRLLEDVTAAPLRLVLQLALEFRPTLAKNGTVQSRFLFHFLAGMVDRSRCGLRHNFHVQFADHNHSVVFAVLVTGLVRRVLAKVCDAAV